MWKDVIQELQTVDEEVQILQQRRIQLAGKMPSHEEVAEQQPEFSSVVKIEIGPHTAMKHSPDQLEPDVRWYIVYTDQEPFLISVCSGDWRDEVTRPKMDTNQIISLYQFIADNDKEGKYNSIVSDPLDAIERIRENEKILEKKNKISACADNARVAFSSIRTKFLEKSTALEYDAVLSLFSSLDTGLKIIDRNIENEGVTRERATSVVETWKELMEHLQNRLIEYWDEMRDINRLIKVLKEEGYTEG